MNWKDKAEGFLEGFFFPSGKCWFDKTEFFCWYIWFLLNICRCWNILFLPFCYSLYVTLLFYINAKWSLIKYIQSKQFVLNVWTFPSMKKNPWQSLLLMIQNETKFWSPGVFPRMEYLVSDCPCFWCSHGMDSNAAQATEIGPKGCSTRHGLRSLLCTASSKCHKSCIWQHPWKTPFYPILVAFSFLIYFVLYFFSLPGTFFTVLACFLLSLKCSGECNVLCWQSICRLENKEECFALA